MRSNIAPKLLPTDSAGHATELARDAVAAGADLVLVLGGDGTINEVVNGIANSTAVLGVLPGGTANVLATELGLGSQLERAAERLGGCVQRRVALGKLISADGAARFFLMMAGVGLDATIVAAVNPGLKAKAGKLAYYAAGIGQIANRVEQFDARTNGTCIRCGFALLARVRNYGGDLEIARGASLLSDDFEIVLFEGSSALRYAVYFLGVGARCAHMLPGVHTLRAKDADLSGDALVQIDGETAGRLPVRFEIAPAALSLLVPPQYR